MSDVYINKAKLVVGKRDGGSEPIVSFTNVKKAILYTTTQGNPSIKINGVTTVLVPKEKGINAPRYLELEFGGGQNTFDVTLDSTVMARIYYIIQLA